MPILTLRHIELEEQSEPLFFGCIIITNNNPFHTKLVLRKINFEMMGLYPRSPCLFPEYPPAERFAKQSQKKNNQNPARKFLGQEKLAVASADGFGNR